MLGILFNYVLTIVISGSIALWMRFREPRERRRQEALAVERRRQEALAAERRRQEELAAERRRQEALAVERRRQEELAAERRRQEEPAAERRQQEELAAQRWRQGALTIVAAGSIALWTWLSDKNALHEREEEHFISGPAEYSLKEERHRLYGYFRCGKCGKKWESASSWVNKWQQCQYCESKSYPYDQHPLEKSDRDSRKPHDRNRCQMCIELGRLCSPTIR